MPCLFFSCISTISTLHTFLCACEDRHSPCVFPRGSQAQLGELMQSSTAGTVQEECSSPPCAPRYPPGLAGLANRRLMRALSLRDEDVLIPLLSLQPLPAHGCHPCLLSRSLASTAGRRGQNQFPTGLRTGSVGPMINYRASAFCRSSQVYTFVHPTG